MQYGFMNREMSNDLDLTSAVERMVSIRSFIRHLQAETVLGWPDWTPSLYDEARH